MSAKPLAYGVMLLLAGMVTAWHVAISPPQRLSPWLATALHLAVLAPGLVLLALRDRRAAFFGALGALLLFCHGVMEAWTTPSVRGLALAEAVLSVLVILGASLDGMRARFAKKRGV